MRIISQINYYIIKIFETCLQVKGDLHEEGPVGVRLHLDDEVLAEVIPVAVALFDPARRVDLPEAAQANTAPDAPLNAPEKIEQFGMKFIKL